MLLVKFRIDFSLKKDRKIILKEEGEMFINLKTNSKSVMLDITDNVRKFVRESGVSDGFVHIFSMHTTGGITINENADPDVRKDINDVLNNLIPWENNYHHLEGNTAAHVKTSLVGSSEIIPIENNNLVLGTWQGIFFCEFDGPRTRKVHVKFI